MSEERHVWEEEGEEVSYLKELVTSQTSVVGLLVALLVGAILSFPLGLGPAVIPVLLYAAGQSIAALFIPSSPAFQERVDRRKRRERRERARGHLMAEIERRVSGPGGHWNTYHRMREHLASLEALAQSRETALTEYDIERLEDATVDYLSLWVAALVISERRMSVDTRGLEQRLHSVEGQLERDMPATERHKLERAREDLRRVRERHRGLRARATSIDAAMLSMADTFEEVFQRVMTNPTSSEASGQLQQAVDRMRLEEELDMAVDAELDDLLHRERRAAASQRAG